MSHDYDIKKAVAYSYNSVLEFGQAVKSVGPRLRTAQDHSETEKHATNGFTFDTALECALHGGNWAEGAQNLLSVELKDSDWSKESLKPQLKQCVAGAVPLVPVWLAGQPDNMLTTEFEHIPSKIIKIGVHVGRSYNIKDEESLNRGRAILACIDALEAQGYSCELWAVWRNAPKSGLSCSNISVCLKQSNEAYSPASVAFALCSTAFQRRLCWRLIESCPKSWGLATKSNKYGHGGSAYLADFDIALPYFDHNQYNYFCTPKKALNTVEKIFDIFLSNQKGAA